MIQGNGPTDRELIKRAKNNDVDAFHELHQKYKNRILNYVYRYVRNYAVAEEVTQDTFIKVYENLDKYKPTGTVRGWIYTIAANTAKNKIRDLSKKKEVSLNEPLAEDGSFTLEDTIEDKRPDPGKEVEGKALSARLHQGIGKLSEKHKEVIILCGVQGLSYKEAAEVMGCNIETVGVRLMRAREKLKELLEESE